MDALVLDIAVQVMSALSMALLGWGGWLCFGGAPRGRNTGAAEHAEARFS